MTDLSVAVFNALAERGIRFQRTPFAADLQTVDQVAATLGIAASQIVKALLIKAEGERPLVVGLPGDRRLDPAVLGAALPGRRPRLAKRSEVAGILGVQPGAVTPLLGAVGDVEVILDRAILSETTVNVSSGELDLGISLSPRDLLVVSGGRCLDLDGRSSSGL